MIIFPYFPVFVELGLTKKKRVMDLEYSIVKYYLKEKDSLNF